MPPEQLSVSEGFRKLEEASQQLEDTAILFLNSCSGLERSGVTNADLGHLISRINDQLGSFDSLITRRLVQARSSLTSLKNVRMSPIQRLPPDILAQIFRMVVYDLKPQVEDPKHLSLSYRSKSIYRKLYRLLHVCVSWKRILFSEGTFWSLLPVVGQDDSDDEDTLDGAKYNLEMAAGARLHLVAELVAMDAHKFILDTLARCGSRIKAVNISSHIPSLLEEVVEVMIREENHLSNSLTSLSLYFSHASNNTTPLQGASWRKNIDRILEPLLILRLRKVFIRFEGLCLKNLTELRLQDIRTTTIADIEDILWTLSSSPHLQVLELISISAHPNPPDTASRSYKFPISLRSLKELYLSNLAHDVLEHVLGSIAPGAHHITLNLTNTCLKKGAYPNHSIVFGPDESKLPSFKVDALMIASDYACDLNTVPILLRLLHSATELIIDQQHLDAHRLKPFINPLGPGVVPNGGDFPRFTKIHVSRSRFDDATVLKALQDVVSSHPVVELGLGLGIRSHWCTQYEHLQYPPQEFAPYKQWFLDAVPSVVWLPGPPRIFEKRECVRDIWQL